MAKTKITFVDVSVPTHVAFKFEAIHRADNSLIVGICRPDNVWHDVTLDELRAVQLLEWLRDCLEVHN